MNTTERPTVTIIYRDPAVPEWGFELTTDSREVCIEAISRAFDFGSTRFPPLVLPDEAA